MHPRVALLSLALRLSRPSSSAAPPRWAALPVPPLEEPDHADPEPVQAALESCTPVPTPAPVRLAVCPPEGLSAFGRGPLGVA